MPDFKSDSLLSMCSKMAVNGADLDESLLSKASSIRMGSADEGM